MPKVSLEPLAAHHAKQKVSAALESVAEVSPWMPWCSERYCRADADTWIEEQALARREGTAYEFAVLDAAGAYVGGAGINCIRQDHHFANVGYWIRSSRTQQGLGTAALRALVAWSEAHTSLKRLEVVVALDNPSSQRVAEKAGATKESLARARLYLRGKFHDAYIYTFIRA